MKCVLFNQSVKVLSRAIHSLARIGDDLVIEPFKDGFKLSTVDKSEAAYSQFWFPVSFFYSYQYENTENADDLRLRISFKAFLTVFKTCHSVDKIVQSCTITIEKDVPAIVIKMQFTAGYSKTHQLFVSDCLPINANFLTTNRNEIVLSAKLLSNALRNFQTHQSEITLSVDSRKTIIHNFDDKTLESIGQNIRSQLSLDAGEFTSYRIGVDTAIMFTVREVKAMLAFAENVSGVLKITFDEPPKAIVFNILDEGKFEANYLLATDASRTVTMGSSSSEASSSLAANRGRPIRRVLSDEEPSGGDAKRVCTNESRAGANNNDGNDSISRRRDVVEEGSGELEEVNVLPNISQNKIPAGSSRSEAEGGGANVFQNMPQNDRREELDSKNNNSSMNRSSAIENRLDSERRFDDLGDNLEINNEVEIMEENDLDNIQNRTNVRNNSVSLNNEDRNNRTSNNVNGSTSSANKKQSSLSSSNKSHFNEKFTSIENILFGGGNARDVATNSKVNDRKVDESLGSSGNKHSRNGNVTGKSISYGTDNFDMDDNVFDNLGNRDNAISETNAQTSRQQNGVDKSEVYSEYNESKQNSNHDNRTKQNGNPSNQSKQNGHHSNQTSLRHASKSNTRNPNSISDNSTRTENSNQIESFDPAHFPRVEDNEMDCDTQETTVTNVCTPLNPDKLKIVFKHCLEGEGRNGEKREGGRVLVYSSDDENS